MQDTFFFLVALWPTNRSLSFSDETDDWNGSIKEFPQEKRTVIHRPDYHITIKVTDLVTVITDGSSWDSCCGIHYIKD